MMSDDPRRRPRPPRRQSMRRRQVLAVVVAVTASSPVWNATEPAGAGCAGPSITVGPSEAAPGAPVTVTGKGFWDGCNDVRHLYSGTDCNRPDLSTLPQRNIDLVLLGPDRERLLATVDGPAFEQEVAIPPDTPAGEATIAARIDSDWYAARPVAFTVATGEPVEPQPPRRTRQVGLAAPGYRLAATDGGVFAFGARRFHGSASHLGLNAPVVGIASTPRDGYWLAADDGGVFAYGAAGFLEADEFDPVCEPSVAGPVTAIASRPSGDGGGEGEGYWTTTRRGYVSRFGAGFYGAAFPFHPSDVDHGAVVALASHPRGYGYWQATANGGVFAFGEAPWAGSLANVALQAPVVAMAATATGNGYWLAAADGGVFAFGDAPFHGSLGGRPLNAPVVGIAPAPDGDGYWLAAADGGVFAFGSAPFLGSLADIDLNGPIVGIAA